tara:strand:- start:27336 stop:29177 length:1842 start_codon:yes stop_codon:yes gene_type:complete
MPEKPILITDTTFRDGHQSLLATRLRTSEMELIAEEMNDVGFHSMEVWGGATFDSATRYLAEDPWDRLRTFKRLMPATPLAMLLRGQSLVGYRTYPDDLVRSFISTAASQGIDIFRVFDALNDEKNLSTAANSVKENGKHLQMTICYSITEEGGLLGSIYNIEYYKALAIRFEGMGADSICIKDMAGILAPYDAFNLISELKKTVSVPIQLHTHYTSGMASMTALKAIEAGLDILDTCLAPLALRTAQPAIEPLLVALSGSGREPDLDLDKIVNLGDQLESILEIHHDDLQSHRASVIDSKVLIHQIPGGMASNLIAQLKEADALDRLEDVLTEIPATRKDLGYPPLVTPISQMVGSQSVINVLQGRYNLISDQVKDYVYGMYGTPPAPIDTDLAKLALADYQRGSEPFNGRPAELLEPEMEQSSLSIKDITTNIEDILTYSLFPTTGLRFIKMKHGLENIPEDMKPKASRAHNDQQPAKIVKKSSNPPPKTNRARKFNVYVEGEFFEVEVDPADHRVTSAGQSGQLGSHPQTSAATNSSMEMSNVVSPMPGILLKYLVNQGDVVNAGDQIAVLEAMKMENSLPCSTAGTVGELPVTPGTMVTKGQILATIVS